jgi:hypothetical protein
LFEFEIKLNKDHYFLFVQNSRKNTQSHFALIKRDYLI